MPENPAVTPEPTPGQTSEGDTPARRAASTRAQAYSERLYAAWWVWLLPLAGAALLAASVRRGYPGLPGWLPYAVLLPIAVYMMLAMSRSRIRVIPEYGDVESQQAELHVGQAHLPVRFIGSVEVIGKDAKRLALGPHLDPAAYIVHRGSIGPLLRVELTDPDDETPYWLFSTRKPERLARALGASA